MEESGQLHDLAALIVRKEPAVSFNMKLGGPQGHLKPFGAQKSVAPPGNLTPTSGLCKP